MRGVDGKSGKPRATDIRLGGGESDDQIRVEEGLPPRGGYGGAGDGGGHGGPQVEMCNDFTKDRCTRGSSCRFSHGEAGGGGLTDARINGSLESWNPSKACGWIVSPEVGRIFAHKSDFTVQFEDDRVPAAGARVSFVRGRDPRSGKERASAILQLEAHVKEEAGLDEGLRSLSLFNLLYTENPYRYNKFQ